MKIRSVLSAAVLAVATTFAATQALAQDKFTLKLAETWGPNFPIFGDTTKRFAETVEKMSDGRLTIRIDSANKHKAPLGVFDMVKAGQYDMGHSASYYWKGKVPETLFFTSMPFGMNAMEQYAWFYHGGGMELMQEVYEPHNMLSFPGGNTGNQMAGWFNKEINSVDDLKGLKIRMPGLAGEVIKRLGAIPVQMPGGEVFTSLQTGALDAADWVGPYNDLAFGLYKVVKYYYYPGWQEPGSALEVIINKDAWNSLPQDLQHIVRSAAEAENQHILDEFTARNADALKQLVNEHGVQLRRLPDDVLMALKDTSDQVIEEVIAGDELSRRIYESIVAFRDASMPYQEVAEQALLNSRTLVLKDA